MDQVAIIAAVAGIIIQILVSLFLFVKTWGSFTQKIENQDKKIIDLETSMGQLKITLKGVEDGEKASIEDMKESINDLKQEIMTSLTRLNTGLTGMDGTNGIAGRLTDLTKTVASLEKQVTIIQTTLNNFKRD